MARRRSTPPPLNGVWEGVVTVRTESAPGCSVTRPRARAATLSATALAVLEGGADGLDATSEPPDPAFPLGLVVAMNSGGGNYFYRPEDLGLLPRSLP